MRQGIRFLFIFLLLSLGMVAAIATAQQTETDKQKNKGNESNEPATLTEEQELTLGKQLYDQSCKGCHRSDGKGTLEEMDLTDSVWKHGNTPEEVEKVIREGIKGTGMRAILGEPTDQQIKALVKYVLKFSANAAQTAPADTPKPVDPPKPPPC